MSLGQEMIRACRARLTALVTEGERVLAAGTADEFPEPSGDLGGQGQWRFLVVTNERLLLADWSKPEKPREEINFDEVSAWSDGMQYHRYVMLLQHPPITREERLPTRWLPWFGSGERSSVVARTSTTLRFSQRNAAAAMALRAVLDERDLPHERLSLLEVSREERTAFSHGELSSE